MIGRSIRKSLCQGGISKDFRPTGEFRVGGKEADEPKEWVFIFPKSAEGALEAAMEALEE